MRFSCFWCTHHLRLDLWKFLSSEKNWDTKKSAGTSVLKKSTSEIPIPFTLWWTNMAIEIPIFNRRYIFTRSIFCCHVSLLEGTQSVIPLSYYILYPNWERILRVSRFSNDSTREFWPPSSFQKGTLPKTDLTVRPWKTKPVTFSKGNCRNTLR